MASNYAGLGYAQVRHLQPGDIIRFMDPDTNPEVAAVSIGWLVVIDNQPAGTPVDGIEPTVRRLTITRDGVDRHSFDRRSWAGVQILTIAGNSAYGMKWPV